MAVDQPGQQGAPAAVDAALDRARPRVALAEQAHDAPVRADHQPVEMLQPPVGPDLHAVDMVDQRVGDRDRGGGGEEQRRGCEKRGAHDAWLSIVWDAVKG